MQTVKATCVCGWSGNNFDLVTSPHERGSYLNCPVCGMKATLHPYEVSKYQEGADAFHADKQPEDNPYPENTEDHEDWFSGYLQADAQEAGENGRECEQ